MKNNWIVIGLLICIIGMLIIAGYYLDRQFEKISIKPETVVMYRQHEYLQREAINEKIREFIRKDKYANISTAFQAISADRAINYIIISEALNKKIPVNLFFALCQIESSFKINAKHKNKNKKGKVLSIDWGLYALNSYEYRKIIAKYGLNWLLMPENNIRLGAEHLRRLYEQYGNWNIAIMRYNGQGDRAGIHALKVLDAEREIDKLINEGLRK